MTSFENKCKIIADLWADDDNLEILSEVWEHYNISTLIAYALDRGFVLDISEQAEADIEILFADILSEYNLEDTGFSDYRQIVK